MNRKHKELIARLQEKQLTPQQKQEVMEQLRLFEEIRNEAPLEAPFVAGVYDYHDLQLLHGDVIMRMAQSSMHSLDDLIARDGQREKDGFPRKIRIGKMIKPSQSGAEKVVVVPTTVEEKLLHDSISVEEEEEGGEGGSGEGEEGEVIGEQPIRQEG
ncbi:MAG TPA: hypothetical protein VJ969_06025, partial [Desulfopila sp.]|nr:hypothetical protein [Desulfopila sp.]